MEWLLSLLGIATAQGQAAVIQGLLSFFGVLITGGIAIWTWNRNRGKKRQDREDLRVEKRNDLLRAIWSDITPVWTALYLQGRLDYRLGAAEARFSAAERDAEDFTPFVTQVAGTLFGDSLMREIVYLETDEIEPVVKFYHQIETLNQMAGDMRTERFTKLPLPRKKAMLLDLIRLDHRLTVTAEDALRRLQTTLNLPPNRRVDSRKGPLDATRLQ